MIWNALRDELFLTSNKRRKTAPLGTVSTVVLTGLGQARGICCLADGSILLTAHNKILVRFPSALLPCTTLAGREGRGRADGTLLEGSFYEPSGIVVRSNDEIVVVDSGNNTLRIIHRLKREDRHMIYTLAGDATEEGFFDGPAVDLHSDGQALFKNPSCAVLLEDGEMAILDTDNHALRHLTATGRVSTLAGCGKTGFLDGPGRDARFCFPTGLAFDPTEKRLIVSDTGNHAIRMICMQGIVTTIAGGGAPGFLDGLCGDALFFSPMHVVVDGKGTIVIADRANNRIRAIEKTTPLSVKTLAGGENVIGPMSHQRVDGPALDARFKDPAVLALDPTGRLLVAELNAPDQVRVVVVGLFPPVCLYEQLPEMMQLASRANARVKAVEDLSRLADDTETADVVVVVQGESFHMHSAVVSQRCAYIEKFLKFHGRGQTGREIVLEDLSAAAFRVVYRYMYAAVLPGFPNLKEELDTPCLESVTLAREVLMTADKWGIDELYQHLLEEFKRDLTHSNCTETLVWSMTKGTAQTSKIALAFFVQHRHEVKKHSADTLELLNILDEEQMREVLVAVL